MTVTVREGDCLDVLRTLDAQSVQCCVTSPPYFGLRDYGHAGQIGLEPTPDEYVAKLVAVFGEVRRVLADDGTLWLNIGDSYNAYNGGAGPGSKLSKTQTEQRPRLSTGYGLQVKSLKPKDLMMIPARVALALQADGWYVRSDVIWHKPNPMPESVVDRPTKSHEYLFLLSKNERYYYDADAIREPLTDDRDPSRKANANGVGGRARSGNKERAYGEDRGRPGSHLGAGVPWEDDGRGRNKRSVWTVPVQPYTGAHFATFPPALIKPCILAGSRVGDTVLDPFGGAGTTGLVADRLSRHALLIELNPEYAEMARRRIKDDSPLFGDVA